MWGHCARSGECGYFKETTGCLSALYAADRHDELFALIAKSEYRYWHYRVEAQALVKMGRRDEAVQYAQDSKGLNTPLVSIAAFCESVLLDAGFLGQHFSSLRRLQQPRLRTAPTGLR